MTDVRQTNTYTHCMSKLCRGAKSIVVDMGSSVRNAALNSHTRMPKGQSIRLRLTFSPTRPHQGQLLIRIAAPRSSESRSEAGDRRTMKQMRPHTVGNPPCLGGTLAVWSTGTLPHAEG
jgi:hypothetical protein